MRARNFTALPFPPDCALFIPAHLGYQVQQMSFHFRCVIEGKGSVSILQNPVSRAFLIGSFYQPAVCRYLVKMSVIGCGWSPTAFDLHWNRAPSFRDKIIRFSDQFEHVHHRAASLLSPSGSYRYRSLCQTVNRHPFAFWMPAKAAAEPQRENDSQGKHDLCFLPGFLITPTTGVVTSNSNEVIASSKINQPASVAA